MDKSETFCILPWTHIATWTDGSALLCCVAQNSHKLNFNKDSVDTIWNSEHFKDARVKMLKGEKCDLESSKLSKREWNELMESFGFKEHIK